jgi:hypothetical protein
VSFFVQRFRPTADSATSEARRIRTRRGNEGGVDRQACAQTTTGVDADPDRGGLHGQTYTQGMSRLFRMAFADLYLLYVAKLERKGRSASDLDRVIEWLTGIDEAALIRHREAGTSVEEFFANASVNPNASLITGMICGIRVEEIDDPLMQRIRYLDKLVDELAHGKSLEKVLRD